MTPEDKKWLQEIEDKIAPGTRQTSTGWGVAIIIKLVAKVRELDTMLHGKVEDTSPDEGVRAADLPSCEVRLYSGGEATSS